VGGCVARLGLPFPLHARRVRRWPLMGGLSLRGSAGRRWLRLGALPAVLRVGGGELARRLCCGCTGLRSRRFWENILGRGSLLVPKIGDFVGLDGRVIEGGGGEGYFMKVIGKFIIAVTTVAITTSATGYFLNLDTFLQAAIFIFSFMKKAP